MHVAEESNSGIVPPFLEGSSLPLSNDCAHKHLHTTSYGSTQFATERRVRMKVASFKTREAAMERIKEVQPLFSIKP